MTANCMTHSDTTGRPDNAKFEDGHLWLSFCDEANVEESLKTGRFTHRLLLTISAAALLFGITPDKKLQLDRAIAELDRIGNLDFAAYALQSLRKDPHFKTFDDNFQTYCRAVGCKRQITHQLPTAMSHDNVEYASVFELPSQTSFGTAHVGASYVTLDVLRTYVLTPQKRTVFIPSWDKLQNGMGQSLGLESGKQSPLQIRWERGGLSYEPPLNGGVSGQGGLVLRYARQEIEMDPLDLIRDRKLVETAGSHEVVFPELQRHWDEVGNKTAREAKSILAGRKEALSESVSFIGMSVPADLALFGGPLVIAIIGFYLHSHINHMLRLVTDQRSRQIKDDFPWLLLYTDPLSRRMVFVSVVLIPVVAIVSVIYRAWGIGSVAGILMAAACLLSSLYISWKSWRTIV